MGNTIGTTPAKQDANQEYTIAGISGTLGPTYGTAEPRPITVTEDGKLKTETTVALNSGTLSTIGTVGTITRIQTIGTLEVGTITSVTPGTASTNLGKADNAVFVGSDTGVMALGVYNTDTIANGLGAHAVGDYVPPSIDAGANLRIGLYTGNAEYSSASSGGDGASNTSRGLSVYSRPSMYNGSTWDRMIGNLTDGLTVNLGANNDVTVATIAGIGVVTSITEIANVAKGTITRVEQGSINVTAGTIGTVGAVAQVHNAGTVQAGTITRLEGGTLGILSQGSVNVTAGTVGGKAASGAAAVANPVLTAGTDAGGTVYAPLMTTTGHQLIDVLSGTIQSSGTTTGVGVVTSVTNLAAGTVTRLEQGSVNVTAGTMIVTNGTIGAGTIAVSLGTVGGKAASGAAAVANPVLIAGTDAGGTVYSNLMTTTGHQIVDVAVGTITNSGTTTGVGTVSGVAVVTSLSAGTITRLEGGTVGLVTRVGNVGTLEVGTISTLPNIPGGTIGSVSGVGVVTSITGIASGTINNSGTTTGVGVVTSVTNLAGGTVQQNPKPTIVTNSFGTTTNGTIGTLVAAPSAGSAIFITSLDVQQQSGTAETVVSFGLAANGNQVVSRGNYMAGGGIAKSYPTANSGSATGTALTYNMLSGSGTVSYTVAYFIAVP